MSHPDPLTRLTWAYKADGVPGPAKAVLAYLAFADGPRGCFPSIGTICKATGFGRTAVRSALDQLEDAFLIERQVQFVNNRQTTNFYILDYAHIRTGLAAHQDRRGVREREAWVRKPRSRHHYAEPEASPDDRTGPLETSTELEEQHGVEPGVEREREHEVELESKEADEPDPFDTSSPMLHSSAFGAGAPQLESLLEGKDQGLSPDEAGVVTPDLMFLAELFDVAQRNDGDTFVPALEQIDAYANELIDLYGWDSDTVLGRLRSLSAAFPQDPAGAAIGSAARTGDSFG